MSQAGRAAAGLSLGAVALGESGCAVAPKVYWQAPSQSPRKEGEKIRLGAIGLGGRGRWVLGRFIETKEVEAKALCDVNKLALKEAASTSDAPTCGDYREILKRDDVDAVLIATPDHWHAIIAIEACKAGKDVYVEKPLCLCVAEGRRMIQAARKHGRILQMGTQQLSGEHYHEARKLIQGGKLGKVTMVRVWNFRNSYPGKGHPPDSDPPATMDWDRWLGPRPVVPYNPVKASGAFRNFWEYAGGILTDWGTHHYHTILDIMGYKPPTTISAAGGRYVIDDLTTVPDTLSVLYQFPDWTMEFSSRETNGMAPYGSEYGIEFCGVEGAMFLDRKGFIITPEKDRTKPEIVGNPAKDNFLPPGLDNLHVRNFLKCVRSRELPASDVEAAHKATTLSHLGNIAIRVGRQIRWDAETECIPGDREADALLRRTYRKPYILPEV